MTFDITKVKITSKLMLLQGGCKNFRSVGDEMVINYAEHKSLLCIAESNGSGKSTIFEHLPLYAITGGTSSKSDKVDALINTTVGKNMVCWLVWYFAGTYYKVIRGRKPNVYDIYSLVNEEWVEIPNLPVSSRDRQLYQYSIMGLDHKTAVNVIENTILLSGQRFKGFSSLSTPERRDLIEPILDLSIFSALNQETKTLRGEVIVDQKQTYLELTDVKLQTALCEQEVEHKKQNIESTTSNYEVQKEILEAKVGDCEAKLKEALELDTGGSELHIQFESESEDLSREEHKLKVKLEEDLSNLGEFVVDHTDPVLTKLGADLYVIDQNIEMVKEDLETKRKSLSEEVLKVKGTLEQNLTSVKTDYERDLLKAQEEYNDELEDAQSFYDSSVIAFNKAKEVYALSVEHQSDCSVNVEGLTKELEDATTKEVQYKGKCDKLSSAVVFLEAKKSQEESNLEGLVHAGECPSCKSQLSEEYVQGLKEDLNSKISKIGTEITEYKERLVKGNDAIEALGIAELKEGLRVATLQLSEAKPDKYLVERAEQTLTKATESLDVLKSQVVGDKLTQRYEVDTLNLQNKLDKAEAEIKDSLGELETQYNMLVGNKPTQVENIEQNRLDRIEALKGEFGGKERSLNSVYELSVANVHDRLKTAKRRLEEGLQRLVADKESKVKGCDNALEYAKHSLVELTSKYETKLKSLTSDYDKALAKHFCKVTDLIELNKKHDKQQQDIDDYNDLLLLLSDKEGKADIVRNVLPKLNKDVNNYLEAMGLFIDLEIDTEFNITMNSEDRKGQSLFSLSAGQKSKVDLSLLLSLRDLASSKESVACSLLILDEILEPFSSQSLTEIILMLQERFKDNNIVLITQRGDEVKDLFKEVKNYGLRGGFTVELQNEA